MSVNSRKRARRNVWRTLLLVLVAILIRPVAAHAQGCIIAHSVSNVGGPQSQGGYLQEGHWQLTFDYRHQYSFRHFVGSTEQVYRQQEGSQVRNRINLFDATLTYQATPRWSLNFTLPMEFATRKYTIPGNGSTKLGDYHVSGIGDVSLTAQRWMWDPQNNPSHNIQLGFGLQMPTGSDNIQNHLVVAPGQPAVDSIADYSIQPGTGGWGVIFSWASFQDLGSKAQLYFNGNYLITPQETNGVPKAGTPGSAAPPPQEQFISISDEYLLEAGVAFPIKSIKGLTLTFGPRDEGVPAHDLIGGSEGWRRPGYAISIEPGFQYVFHNGSDLITGSIGRAFYRNRTRSVPDTQLGTHGDAAFADYVWLASFSHRF